jgi:hypothetical protein
MGEPDDPSAKFNCLECDRRMGPDLTPMLHSCGHYACVECAAKWKQDHNTCIFCKVPVIGPDEPRPFGLLLEMMRLHSESEPEKWKEAMKCKFCSNVMEDEHAAYVLTCGDICCAKCLDDAKICPECHVPITRKSRIFFPNDSILRPAPVIVVIRGSFGDNDDHSEEDGYGHN